MKDFELKIEYLDIDKLTPYEGNARKHQDLDVSTIKNSISEFGMCDPIGIWSDKNIIVEGHGRLMALKQLGIEKAPCIRLDHLSDDQRREYALAHNKTAEMSEWDWDKLKDELAELAEVGMDMTKFGFDAIMDEIDDMPTNFESDDERSNVAVVTIKFANVKDYEKSFEQLKQISENNNGIISVNMQ